MFGHRGLDLRRIDVGAAAQNHVGEAVTEIEIALRIEPSDVAERFPAVGAALRLGAEIVIGGAGAVIGQEVDFAGLAGGDLVCRLLLEKKKKNNHRPQTSQLRTP